MTFFHGYKDPGQDRGCFSQVPVEESSLVMSLESQIDVLIIGAGPAGLMCANALSSFGVNVRIIDIRQDWITIFINPSLINHVDDRPKSVPAGQADGIQPRTIEVLQVSSWRLKSLSPSPLMLLS